MEIRVRVQVTEEKAKKIMALSDKIWDLMKAEGFTAEDSIFFLTLMLESAVEAVKRYGSKKLAG